MQSPQATLPFPSTRRRRRRSRHRLAGFVFIGVTQVVLGLMAVMLVRAGYLADPGEADIGLLLTIAFVYALSIAFIAIFALGRFAASGRRHRNRTLENPNWSPRRGSRGH